MYMFVCMCVLGFYVMENGDITETGLSESYLTHSYAVMEGKYWNRIVLVM